MFISQKLTRSILSILLFLTGYDSQKSMLCLTSLRQISFIFPAPVDQGTLWLMSLTVFIAFLEWEE